MNVYFQSFLWLLYFLQGIPYGFQTKFLPVFLRSRSISLSLISLTRLLSLPWILKPFWAPLVDKCGSKYAWIACNLIGMALLYLLASLITLNDMVLTVSVVGGLNILAATQDIAVDSMIVDLLSMEEVGIGTIAQVVGYKSGSLLGGGLLGWLSSFISWQNLFFMLFLTYFFSACLVFSPFFSRFNAQLPNSTKNRRKSPENNEKKFDTTPKLTKMTVQLSSPEEIAQKRESHVSKGKKTTTGGKQGILGTYYSIYRDILMSPGTKWTVLYVFIYKLGEQGVISIFPMSLMDQGLTSSQTAILIGVWCQSCSILGSLFAGIICSSKQWNGLCNTLTELSTARLVTAGILIWITSRSRLEANWLIIYFLDCVLHLISGAITTVTFTLMVMCSQRCRANISATHYSTLATFEVIGKLTMVSISGSIVEKTGYNVFFLTCCFLLLLPVIILRIPSRYQHH